MRPSRLVIGEVRSAECLDLLLALNAGLPGMASIHASSARQALVKMCTLPLLAGEALGARAVIETRTPIALQDGTLQPGGSVEVVVPPEHRGFVLSSRARPWSGAVGRWWETGRAGSWAKAPCSSWRSLRTRRWPRGSCSAPGSPFASRWRATAPSS